MEASSCFHKQVRPFETLREVVLKAICEYVTDWSVEWMIDWLFGWKITWLVDWLTGWLSDERVIDLTSLYQLVAPIQPARDHGGKTNAWKDQAWKKTDPYNAIFIQVLIVQLTVDS